MLTPMPGFDFLQLLDNFDLGSSDHFFDLVLGLGKVVLQVCIVS
jgi:hypothetical protein